MTVTLKSFEGELVVADQKVCVTFADGTLSMGTLSYEQVQQVLSTLATTLRAPAAKQPASFSDAQVKAMVEQARCAGCGLLRPQQYTTPIGRRCATCIMTAGIHAASTPAPAPLPPRQNGIFAGGEPIWLCNEGGCNTPARILAGESTIVRPHCETHEPAHQHEWAFCCDATCHRWAKTSLPPSTDFSEYPEVACGQHGGEDYLTGEPTKKVPFQSVQSPAPVER